MRRGISIIAILLSACVWARGEGKEATVAQFTLSSPSLRNNQPIPAKHSCEGGDASPELKWEGAPAGTKRFALICDDPDAHGGTWVHWVIYGLPASTIQLPENVAKTGTVAALNNGKQGVNDVGKPGYG